MTEINKAISRRTRGAYSVLYREPSQIVVTFCVGDLIEFREAGCRKRWQIPIDAAFRVALRAQVEAEKRAKREARRGR